MTHHKRIRIFVLLPRENICKVSIPFPAECCPGPGRDIYLACYKFYTLELWSTIRRRAWGLSASGSWDCSGLCGMGRETSKALKVYDHAKGKNINTKKRKNKKKEVRKIKDPSELSVQIWWAEAEA